MTARPSRCRSRNDEARTQITGAGLFFCLQLVAAYFMVASVRVSIVLSGLRLTQLLELFLLREAQILA